MQTEPLNDRDPSFDVDHPDSRYWRRDDGKLIRFPGNHTRASWQIVGDASYARAADLPDD